MASLKAPTLEQFEKILTDQQVRTIQILHLALGVGVFVFACIVGTFSFFETSAVDLDVNFVWILTLGHLMLAMVLFFSSFWLYQRSFSRETLESRFSNGEISADGALAVVRTALIVRLAMMEGAAMMGVLVCLYAGMGGVLQSNSVFWVNMISPAAMLFFVARNYPTRDELMSIYEEGVFSSAA